MTAVAIMQPTFLPWVGYFALMQHVDHFVFLDDVQFSKQSWQSRNFIKSANGKVLLSLRLSANESFPLINEVRLAGDGHGPKILRSIRNALARTPYLDEVRDVVENGFEECHGSLCKLNTSIIRKIAELANIRTSLHISSSLNLATSDRGLRLVSICNALGATTYVSPIGAFEYLQDSNPFVGSNVELRFIRYRHPVYKQPYPPFLPYMGSIDALANVGPEAFSSLCASGIEGFSTIEQLRGTL